MGGAEHATYGILVLMVLFIGPVLVYVAQAKRRRDLYVRRIPGVDAVDEAIGRSAELGRAVSFTTGLTGVGPVLYACLGVLHHVARRTARYKSKLLIPQNQPDVMAIVEDVSREAYRDEGRSGLFDPAGIVYLSQEQLAFAAGYSGLMQRERVAAAFLFGEFAAESLLLAEAGQQVGAMQIGASVSPEQVPFFICTCDYTLIGEELFAASAYLTREPVQLGSLLGQDRAKFILVVLILIGVCIATFNQLYPEYAIANLDAIIMKPYWSP